MDRRIMRAAVGVLFAVQLVVMGACAGSEKESSPSDSMESHFHVRRVSNSEAPAAGWVVLLPGASGLKVFDDEGHYFRAAAAINAMGYDAVVIDYKAAYRAATKKPDGPARVKIAWVVEQAVGWMRARGDVRDGEPGAIVAWSLGAEGAWSLLGTPGRASSLGVRGSAMYYPSNEDDVKVRTDVPLLILTGSADDVTPVKEIRASVESAGSALVTLKVFEGAGHGFDVESLATPRTVELIPFIGPRATFGYDAAAAASAHRELEGFLAGLLGGGARATR